MRIWSAPGTGTGSSTSRSGWPARSSTIACILDGGITLAHAGRRIEQGRGYTGTMLASKILIPVDGSPASLRALDYAIKMAAQIPGLSFVLLNVQNVSATELSGELMYNDWQE